MPCPKEKESNPQCQGCTVKDAVHAEGPVLMINPDCSNMIRWKKVPGDAWISMQSAVQAHCPRGIEIQPGS
jgi:hypothetical protein